jgi:hypothetical protein
MRGAWAKARHGKSRHPAVDSACPVTVRLAFRTTAATFTAHYHHSPPLNLAPPPPPPLTANLPRRRERYPPTSFSAAVKNGQRSLQAQSKSRACVTTGRAYSDEVVAAHRVGGLQRDRASTHRSEHIRRRATRAYRHCYQAAQT